MAGGAASLPNNSKLLFKQKLMERNYIIPFCLVTSLFFAWGFAYGLLDVLNKHFQNVLGISKLQSTGLQIAYFGIGYFCFSPVAGQVLKKFGYKKTILMGLTLYSTGAIFFWPVAKFSSKEDANKHSIFAGFVICTAVIACGLASLEVSANSYITVMRPTPPAALRLQLSQSFNGVASFSGPLIASKYFFSDENSKDLGTVQFVYMAVAGLGLVLGILFLVTKLPEVSEEELELDAADQGLASDAQLAKGFWSQTRPLLGFWAQFFYVGLQVNIGSFFVNYTHEAGGLSDADAAQRLSMSLIIFTVARFAGTALLSFFSPSLLLIVNAGATALCIALTGSLSGSAGVGAIMASYFFQGGDSVPAYLRTLDRKLGSTHETILSPANSVHRWGSDLSSHSGGFGRQVWYGTKVSMWVNFPGACYVALFGVYLWRSNGFKLTRADEIAYRGSLMSTADLAPASNVDEYGSDEKDKEIEHLESVRKA